MGLAIYKNHDAGSTNSIVQSIQQFSITIGASSLSNTATINSVDTTQSATFVTGAYASAKVADKYTSPLVQLTNGTTVTASRKAQDGSTTVTVTGYIVQFNSGVLKQNVMRGTLSAGTNISPSNMPSSVTSQANTIVLCTGATGDSANTSRNCGWPNDQYIYCISTTQFSYYYSQLFGGGGSSGNGVLGYEVLEFNSSYIQNGYTGSGGGGYGAYVEAGASSAGNAGSVWYTNNQGSAHNLNYASFNTPIANGACLPIMQTSGGGSSTASYSGRYLINGVGNYGIGLVSGYTGGAGGMNVYLQQLFFTERIIKRIVDGLVAFATTDTTKTDISVGGNAINSNSKVIVLPMGVICQNSDSTSVNNLDPSKQQYVFTQSNGQVTITRGPNAAPDNHKVGYRLIEFY